MAKKKPDLNELAHSIVGKATGLTSHAAIKNQAAKLLGRLGGLKGGPARHKALTKARRQEIARKAAESRWTKE